LVGLAEEQSLELPPNILEKVMESGLAADLALWAYGRELIRRTQFASQGGAVHRLWLALDEKARKRLSAEAILSARERLLQWLQTNGKVTLRRNT